VYFDADEWIRLAKDAGMKYFVFTAKHHDGFAMFRSRADSFNVADATPFQRDVVEELANSCARHGLKFGLYYSQELDWAHPHGGGYTQTEPCAGVSWDNSWDFPDRDKKNFDICFGEKIKPQVEEILTNYGELYLIWFDVPHTITPAQSLELYNMVKQYQPNCLINSRLGNGAYDYVSLGDNEYPLEAPPEQISADPNSVNGYKYSPYGLYETPATINRSWGFRYYDQDWLTPEAIRAKREALEKLGVNYLLNVGPDGLGRIPSFCRDALIAAAPKSGKRFL
jgi:alpha-L-fucosidase